MSWEGEPAPAPPNANSFSKIEINGNQITQQQCLRKDQDDVIFCFRDFFQLKEIM